MNFSSSLQLAVLAVLALALSPKSYGSPIGWDFAVTLEDNIQFLDSQWRNIDSAAHKYGDLAALTFDESQELIYFHAKIDGKGRILSLRHDATSVATVEQVVQRTGNDTVTALAYDPLDRKLFWTDIDQGKIFFIPIDGPKTQQPQVLLDLSAEGARPNGLAIDICRRQLYWTNAKSRNASVERVSLNGTERRIIANKAINDPRGIVVDQLLDRVFWIDDTIGIFYAIESAKLDGSDRQLVMKDKQQNPTQLAITDDSIYWTDLDGKEVWKYPKPSYDASASTSNATLNVTTESSNVSLKPIKVASFEKDVLGIVARTGFYQHLVKDSHCAKYVEDMKNKLVNIAKSATTPNPIDVRVQQLQNEHCVNGGTFHVQNNLCFCLPGYTGARCEISKCHNFCVHGTCQIEGTFPKCYCQQNYYGDRCEYFKCNGHCLNNGECSVDNYGGMNCKCQDLFVGTRCEYNLTEFCATDCELLLEKPDIHVPGHCQDFCEIMNKSNSSSNLAAAYHALDFSAPCNNRPSIWTGSVIIVLVTGIVMSLFLVAAIVHGVRLIYKPKRPHIKKTFVVRKQARLNSASDTPLTNRPLTTEQCEITIENCCNMNICETPCFDPKLVEQTFSSRDRKAACIKEDKKILINNMEDDLLS